MRSQPTWIGFRRRRSASRMGPASAPIPAAEPGRAVSLETIKNWVEWKTWVK